MELWRASIQRKFIQKMSRQLVKDVACAGHSNRKQNRQLSPFSTGAVEHYRQQQWHQSTGTMANKHSFMRRFFLFKMFAFFLMTRERSSPFNRSQRFRLGPFPFVSAIERTTSNSGRISFFSVFFPHPADRFFNLVSRTQLDKVMHTDTRAKWTLQFAVCWFVRAAAQRSAPHPDDGGKRTRKRFISIRMRGKKLFLTIYLHEWFEWKKEKIEECKQSCVTIILKCFSQTLGFLLSLAISVTRCGAAEWFLFSFMGIDFAVATCLENQLPNKTHTHTHGNTTRHSNTEGECSPQKSFRLINSLSLCICIRMG